MEFSEKDMNRLLRYRCYVHVYSSVQPINIHVPTLYHTEDAAVNEQFLLVEGVCFVGHQAMRK